MNSDATSIREHRGKTLAGIIARTLEEKILNGELVSGERINEAVLAAQFGVSRGPVREAARALEKSGLVTTIANHGAFVRDVGLEEVLDLYHVRAAITGLACMLACSRLQPGDDRRLLDFLNRMDKAIDANDAEAYFSINLAFHELLVELSGSPRTASLNTQLVNEANLFRVRTLTRRDDMSASNAGHRAIAEAIIARDAAMAQKLAIDHVLAGRQRLLDAYRE